MTSRERQLATIRHQATDQLPVDWIHIDNPAAIAQAAGVAPDKLEVYLGRDGRVIGPADYTGTLPPHVQGRNLPVGSAIWGVEDGNDYGTTHPYPFAEVRSVAAVERYPWPDGAAFREFATVRNYALTSWNRAYAVRGPYWIAAPLFCTACNLFGMEEALIRMLDESAVFEAVLDQVDRFSHTYLERFIDACGDALDILYLADDFASQRGLLMSPALWRRHLKPRYAALFALGKQRGLPIWFHSCGDITAVLPDLIDIGLDVWETVQLQALPLSAGALKREYGRHITFFGGVNTQQLPFVPPATVRRMVREAAAALGIGGGYICGPDHCLKPDVPPANTLALFDEARRWRPPAA